VTRLAPTGWPTAGSTADHALVGELELADADEGAANEALLGTQLSSPCSPS
jgi:hypothetical protein